MTSQPSQLLEATLADLRERGITPDTADILRLHAACENVLHPDPRQRLDLIGVPCPVASTAVYLWPLSVGAAIWLETYAEVWWKASDTWMFWAIAFALAHSRENVFTTLTDKEEAYERVHAWALGVTCSRAELEAAVDWVLGRSDAPPPSKKQQGVEIRDAWVKIIGAIEVQSGIPAETWLWKKSARAVFSAYRHCLEIRAGIFGGVSKAPDDDLNAALGALARTKKAIVQKHKAIQNG